MPIFSEASELGFSSFSGDQGWHLKQLTHTGHCPLARTCPGAQLVLPHLTAVEGLLGCVSPTSFGLPEVSVKSPCNSHMVSELSNPSACPLSFLASPVCPDHQVLASLMQPPGTGNPQFPGGAPSPSSASLERLPSFMAAGPPPPVFQQAVCLPVPTSPGGSRPPPQFLPRDVVLLQCPLCVETPSSSSPAPAALPCRDTCPCLLSCTHPATKHSAFFGSPAELNISHLFL